MKQVRLLYQRARHWMTRGIWLAETLQDRSWRGRLCSALRVVSMTWTGILENNLLSRAAALSYSSMLGLFPMVALMVLFSSAMVDNDDPDFAVKQLNRALEFIAPQLKQMPLPAPDAAAAAEGAAAAGQAISVDPDAEIVKVFKTFIEGTKSKAIGIMGAIALIIIVVQLFSSIESAFNDVWGVRRGRNWVLRIVFYWAAVTLGAVLTFAALTLLAGSTLAQMLATVPGGKRLPQFFEMVAPLLSVGLLACLLTVFYKFIPNTTVRWRPAFVGGAVTVALLYLNNFLAFLYLKRVLLNLSLYGSVSLVPILMLGLFIFWVFLLLGGQITYAVQNANYRSSHLAWNDLNHASRQGVTLLVFTYICRRFRDCLPPYDATELADLLKIPTQVVNASLTRLMQLGLVSRLPPEDSNKGLDHLFQPARPLNRVTLAEFKNLLETHGEGPTSAALDALDPVVRQFHARLKQATDDALGTDTFESIISRLSGDIPAAQTETIGTVRTR
jgi:membrane protein